MRILSIPGRRSTTQYFEFFCDGLDEAGVTVVDPESVDARRLRFDVLHLHFPYHYIVETNTLAAILWFCVFAFVFASMKVLRKRIVYTVHNLTPFHPRREWLLWPYMDMLHGATDGYVFLSPSSQVAFYKRFPGQERKPCIILGHGSFPVTVADTETRARRRRQLVGDTDALVVGYLGFRRPRKGLETVAFLPERLLGGRTVRLVVAGGVQDSFREQADAILRQVPASMLALENRRLSDPELNDMIQTVDVALLPYTIGWNSGMAMLLLSNRTRLLGADMPIFRDLETAVGAPWVYTFPRDPDVTASLAAALDRVAREEPDQADRDRLEQFLAANDFTRGGVRLREFYARLCARPRSANGRGALDRPGGLRERMRLRGGRLPRRPHGVRHDA